MEEQDTSARALIDRLKSKKSVTYDMETHIILLSKVMNNYGGVGTFCDEAGISKPTFYSWQEQNPEFKEAYEILLNRGERMWEKLPLTRPDISMAYWQTIWRNRFNQGRLRLKRPSKDSPTNELQGLDESLYDGHLNIDEHSRAIATLEKKCKIKELEHLLSKLYQSDCTPIAQMNKEELDKEIRRLLAHFKAEGYTDELEGEV